jgi:hypothetical protein
MWAGLGSKQAFELFMTFYGGRNFKLDIREATSK